MSPEVAEKTVDAAVQYVKSWLPRMSAVVIGPGLGREPSTLAAVSRVMNLVTDMNVPLVIDADGLFLVCQSLGAVLGNRCVVLTPNIAGACVDVRG